MSKKDRNQLIIIWGINVILLVSMYIAFEIYSNTPVERNNVDNNGTTLIQSNH